MVYIAMIHLSYKCNEYESTAADNHADTHSASLIQACSYSHAGNKINLFRSVGPYFRIAGPVRKLGMTAATK